MYKQEESLIKESFLRIFIFIPWFPVKVPRVECDGLMKYQRVNIRECNSGCHIFFVEPFFNVS